MTPRFQNTSIALALLALAALLFVGSTAELDPAEAAPTLRTPRIGAQFVALHDDDEDHGEDHGDHDEDDHEDGEDEDIEVEFEMLEFERLHLDTRRVELQAIFGELELIQEIATIAEDEDKSATLAILAASEELEAEDLIPFLEEVVSQTSSLTVRRVAKMKLSEAYADADQPSNALTQLRDLALGR